MMDHEAMAGDGALAEGAARDRPETIGPSMRSLMPSKRIFSATQ